MVSIVRGFVQGVLLLAFAAFCYWVNMVRPAHVRYRPLRLKYWICTCGAIMLFLLICAWMNIPQLLQASDKITGDMFHAARLHCFDHIQNNSFPQAFRSLYDRVLAKEHAAKMRNETPLLLSDAVSTLANLLFMNWGVASVCVPVIVVLLWKLLYRNYLQSLKQELKEQESDVSNWSVLLPVLNNVALLTILTTLGFVFSVEPNRAHRCIYTSGHWYTWSMSTLTFGIVISHLYSYMSVCKSSAQLLNVYLIWFGIYQGLAFTILKRTQLYYHDAVEAIDGIKASLPLFLLFIIILLIFQYITYYGTSENHERQQNTSVTATFSNSSIPNAPSLSSTSLITPTSASVIPVAPTITPHILHSAPPITKSRAFLAEIVKNPKSHLRKTHSHIGNEQKNMSLISGINVAPIQKIVALRHFLEPDDNDNEWQE